VDRWVKVLSGWFDAIDAASHFVQQRLETLLEAQLEACRNPTPADVSEPAGESAAEDPKTPPSGAKPADEIPKALAKFKHVKLSSIAHILVFFLHPSAEIASALTAASLIVIDNISTPLNTQYTKPFSLPDDPAARDAILFAASRKWSIIADLVSALSRLAATQNVPIILLSQVTSRIRPETGAVLHAAVESSAWDAAIANKIILYYDWPPAETEGAKVRYLGVVKARGLHMGSNGGLGKIIAFQIREVCTIYTKTLNNS
jgi:hypothetical protein